MEVIDKIVFGDNQFFGINHMSESKAQQLTEIFSDINNVFKVYNCAFEHGINAVMLNSNDRAKEITDIFKRNKSRYGRIHWYPSIPYPHKYSNMMAEKGVIPAINEILFKGGSVKETLGTIAKGGTVIFGKNAIKLMQMLIDIEMKIFNGLNIKAIFLQNVITDLMLGFGVKDVFYEYSDYIRRKYRVTPGFITLNFPYIYKLFNEWGIKEVAICTSFNKIGFTMSPDVESYISTAKYNNPKEYQIMAMSTMASGAISAKDAYDFINQQNIQSVVFGASSEKNIKETIKLIKL